MMPIQTWTIKNNAQEIQLFEGEIVIKRKLDNGETHVRKIKFKDWLKIKYPVTTIETDTLIYKKMTEQTKPKSLNAESRKIWNFWKSLDFEKIKEVKFDCDDNKFWKITSKYIIYGYYKNKAEKQYYQQRLDELFFYGPKFPSTKLEDRIRAKEIIFNALDNSKLRKKLSMKDGFVLFDYEKIKPLKFEKTKGNSGDYFIIEKGQNIVGGWNGAKEGGEFSRSIEALWYNMKLFVPKIFHKHIPEIKASLETAIIQI